MKNFVLIALVSVFAGAASAQGVDPINTKLRIASLVRVGWDCKLSLKEIASYDGHSVGKRYLCAQLVEVNSEVSLTLLATLVREKKVSFAYAGAQSDSLLKTFNAWREALIKDDPQDAWTVKNVTPWTFSIEKSTATVTTIRLANESAKESITFDVAMKAVFPK